MTAEERIHQSEVFLALANELLGLTDDCFQAAVATTRGLINRLLPLAA